VRQEPTTKSGGVDPARRESMTPSYKADTWAPTVNNRNTVTRGSNLKQGDEGGLGSGATLRMRDGVHDTGLASGGVGRGCAADGRRGWRCDEETGRERPLTMGNGMREGGTTGGYAPLLGQLNGWADQPSQKRPA
jgi:hypothetical protein